MGKELLIFHSVEN